MLTKLAGHPKFGPKLADPTFMAKIQMMQKNPQLLMQDPEMMEVFQVLIGGMGGPGDEDSGNDFPPPSYKPSEPSKPKGPVLNSAQKASMEAKEKGNAFYKAKQFDEALAAYDEAIQADPENIMIENNKAACYIEMGDTVKAIEICEGILKTQLKFEDKAKVLARVAAAHMRAGNEVECIKFYEKAQVENYDKNIERKLKTLELEMRKRKVKEYINPELGLEAKERGNEAFRGGKLVNISPFCT